MTRVTMAEWGCSDGGADYGILGRKRTGKINANDKDNKEKNENHEWKLQQ